MVDQFRDAKRYGYDDPGTPLLGKSLISIDGEDFDTGKQKPDSVKIGENRVSFSYNLDGVILEHQFVLNESTLEWKLSVKNAKKASINITRMIHWLPLSYIMHENIEENLNHSCSMVPSVAGDHSWILCKKRRGDGPDLLVANRGGRMKSMGSLCRYKNLFFEQSAPSLSGLVLHNVVHTYRDGNRTDPAIDWPYKAMYDSLELEREEEMRDSYEFLLSCSADFRPEMSSAGLPLIDYPSMVVVNKQEEVSVSYSSPLVGYEIRAASKAGPYVEYSGKVGCSKEGIITLPAFDGPGERKLVVYFADGSSAFVLFPVYNPLDSFITEFCRATYKERFIADPDSNDYAAYRSLSKQGESCAKGSVLLMKNLLLSPCEEEIRQVEENTVFYLRKRWLNDDFTAVKQYHGGFARIFDMDYLIMQFFLLSELDNSLLKLHDSDTYLLWAYKTALYRMKVTEDKLPREAVETGIASMISWIELEMINKLSMRGFLKESQELRALWGDHVQLQVKKVHNRTFVETEHYFDNAGISMTAETLLNSGELETGLKAARFLLANTADSNDYRNTAPDRWWEALGFMYHNLWAVFSAKAMLSAYEKSGDNRYLFASYKSMMPMFYNYDWNAVSALNGIKPGDGVSAYCITNPNLNLAYASRNRFGQSVFKDDFFSGIDVTGDDWDLGADLIVYLLTFGQKTYVTQRDKRPVCVNGRLEEGADGLRVESYAAYPRNYYFEAQDLTIFSRSRLYSISWIEMRDGNCVKAGIRKNGPASLEDIRLFCRKNDANREIQPGIQWC